MRAERRCAGERVPVDGRDDADVGRAERAADRAVGDHRTHAAAIHRGDAIAARQAGFGRRAVVVDLQHADVGARRLVAEAVADELAVAVERVVRGGVGDETEAVVDRPIPHGIEVGLGRIEARRVHARRQELIPVVIGVELIAHPQVLRSGVAAGRRVLRVRDRRAQQCQGEADRGQNAPDQHRDCPIVQCLSRRPPPNGSRGRFNPRRVIGRELVVRDCILEQFRARAISRADTARRHQR